MVAMFGESDANAGRPYDHRYRHGNHAAYAANMPLDLWPIVAEVYETAYTMQLAINRFERATA